MNISKNLKKISCLRVTQASFLFYYPLSRQPVIEIIPRKTEFSTPVISCKTSKYLMVPKSCDTINVPGSHIENYYVPPTIPSHNMLYNFVLNQGGLELTIPCLSQRLTSSYYHRRFGLGILNFRDIFPEIVIINAIKMR